LCRRSNGLRIRREATSQGSAGRPEVDGASASPAGSASGLAAAGRSGAPSDKKSSASVVLAGALAPAS